MRRIFLLLAVAVTLVVMIALPSAAFAQARGSGGPVLDHHCLDEGGIDTGITCTGGRGGSTNGGGGGGNHISGGFDPFFVNGGAGSGGSANGGGGGGGGCKITPDGRVCSGGGGPL